MTPEKIMIVTFRIKVFIMWKVMLMEQMKGGFLYVLYVSFPLPIALTFLLPYA